MTFGPEREHYGGAFSGMKPSDISIRISPSARRP